MTLTSGKLFSFLKILVYLWKCVIHESHGVPVKNQLNIYWTEKTMSINRKRKKKREVQYVMPSSGLDNLKILTAGLRVRGRLRLGLFQQES